MRYKHEYTIIEKLNAFFNIDKINWTKYVEGSTNVVKVMFGGMTDSSIRIREVVPTGQWHHCGIHR